MPHMSNLPWLMNFTMCLLLMMMFISTYNFKAASMHPKNKTINKDKAKNQWLW